MGTLVWSSHVQREQTILLCFSSVTRLTFEDGKYLSRQKATYKASHFNFQSEFFEVEQENIKR